MSVIVLSGGVEEGIVVILMKNEDMMTANDTTETQQSSLTIKPIKETVTAIKVTNLYCH